MLDVLQIVVLLAVFVRLGSILRVLDSDRPEDGFSIRYLLSEAVILMKSKTKKSSSKELP
jgi:hypothetical protein